MKILQKRHYSFSYIYAFWACHWIGSTCSHIACGCLSRTVGCSFVWYPAALAANLMEISCMFESSLVMCRCVSFERPNQPVFCRVVPFWFSLTSFFTFLHLYSCTACGGMSWMLIVFKWSFSTFESRKPVICLWSNHGIVIERQCYKVRKQNLMQNHSSFWSVITK